jgi:hypothetical protein
MEPSTVLPLLSSLKSEKKQLLIFLKQFYLL